MCGARPEISPRSVNGARSLLSDASTHTRQAMRSCQLLERCVADDKSVPDAIVPHARADGLSRELV